LWLFKLESLRVVAQERSNFTRSRSATATTQSKSRGRFHFAQSSLSTRGLFRFILTMLLPGLSAPVDPQHLLVTSSLFSPFVLAWIRLLFAIYTLTTIITTFVWGILVTKDEVTYFSYFTHLAYIGISSYFWASGFQTWMYHRHGCTSYPLQTWKAPFRFLHFLLASTVITLPILVSIVFWGLLNSPSTFSTTFNAWDNISFHALNTLFVLLEIIFTNVPAPAWILLPFNLLVLAGYLGILYLTKLTQGFYAYEFMDPSPHPIRVVLYVIGIALAECIIFVVVHVVIVLRHRITHRAGNHSRNLGAASLSQDSIEVKSLESFEA